MRTYSNLDYIIWRGGKIEGNLETCEIVAIETILERKTTPIVLVATILFDIFFINSCT